MKNKIEDLRNHLFATLESLQDPDKPMETARAREIANVARVIVDSAKAEIEFVKATGSRLGTGFIPLAPNGEPSRAALAAGAAPAPSPLRVCTPCGQKTRVDPCEHCAAPWQRG